MDILLKTKTKTKTLFLSASEIGERITSCKFSVAFGWTVYGWNEFLMIIAQKYEKKNKETKTSHKPFIIIEENEFIVF